MRLGGTRALAALAAALLAACDESTPTGAGSGTPTPPMPTPRASLRVMPLGDSITQANFERNSYRRPLWQALQAEGFAVDFVGSLRDNHLGPPPNPDFDLDHEGHWGWTADQILAETPGWARRFQPDLVLLQIGTNDVLRGQSLSETLDEVAGIVLALRAANPSVDVLLARLTPFDGPENARLARFNDGIPALVAALDSPRSRVVEVDQFSAIDPVADTADGLHPNAQGEEKLARRWLEALRPLLAARQAGAGPGAAGGRT